MRAAARIAAAVPACALAAYPSILHEPNPFLIAAGVAGAALVAGALVTARAWTAWAGVFLLGLGYVTALELHGGSVDPLAPAVAAGLYLVVEAADVASSDAASVGNRVWHSLAVGFVAAVVVGTLLVAGTAVRSAGSFAVAAAALCGALSLSGFAWLAGARAGRGG